MSETVGWIIYLLPGIVIWGYVIVNDSYYFWMRQDENKMIFKKGADFEEDGAAVLLGITMMWPIILFFCIVIGIPYYSFKIISEFLLFLRDKYNPEKKLKD